MDQMPQGLTPEQQNMWMTMQLQMQQAQANQQLTASQLAQQQALLNEGPKIKYNPIVENADGTFQLAESYKDKGPAALIEAERQRLSQQEMNQKDDLAAQLSGNLSNQRASMASRGGLKGQNAALLNRFNMRDALMAQQKLGQQQAGTRSELETKGMQLQRETDLRNLENLGKGAYFVNQFEYDKWKKQKDVEASKVQADATRASGGGGKK